MFCSLWNKTLIKNKRPTHTHTFLSVRQRARRQSTKNSSREKSPLGTLRERRCLLSECIVITSTCVLIKTDHRLAFVLSFRLQQRSFVLTRLDSSKTKLSVTKLEKLITDSILSVGSPFDRRRIWPLSCSHHGLGLDHRWLVRRRSRRLSCHWWNPLGYTR